MDILKELSEKYGFEERIFLDFSVFEQEERFLEGTGSLVLDRKNRVAYAALSDRTDPGLVDHFCSETGYRAIKFHANQTVGDERLPIYHTNVMMSVGEKVAVICLGAIDNPEENRKVKKELLNSGKAIVEITEEQTAQYAGNMLEVENKDGDHHMVMSSSAYHSLRQDQIDLLERHCTIIHSEINTIETMGGGSARCMMAEIFLPKKD